MVHKPCSNTHMEYIFCKQDLGSSASNSLSSPCVAMFTKGLLKPKYVSKRNGVVSSELIVGVNKIQKKNSNPS